MDILQGKKLTKADGSLVEVDQALASVDVIGLYFSAHWCPPCRGFTPLLADFHAALKEEGKGFEVIFISSDRSDSDMKNYMKESHGDWYAIPFGKPEVDALKRKFEIRGIPALVVISKSGKVITTDGRSGVQMKGPSAYDAWKAQSV